MVAHLELRPHRRNRPWVWLHCSGCGCGQVVSRSKRLDYRGSRRRIFGAGALVTAPLASHLIQSVGVLKTFAYLGVACLLVAMFTGNFMQVPPAGWLPAGSDVQEGLGLAVYLRQFDYERPINPDLSA